MVKKSTQAPAQTAGKIVPPAPLVAPKARQVAAGTVASAKGNKTGNGNGNGITEEQRRGERRQAEQNAAQQFAPAQPPEQTEEQKQHAKFLAEIAKVAEKYGQPLPSSAVPVNATRSSRVKQNGVTRPADGTTTGLVWATADAISYAQGGNPAAISQMKEHPAMANMNDHTLRTQYAAWRKFNGIKGSIVLIKAPQQVGRDAGIEGANGNGKK